MAISYVKEDCGWIEAYDAQGYKLCTVPAKDGLVGHTSSSISVREESWILVFDEQGYQTSSRHV